MTHRTMSQSSYHGATSLSFSPGSCHGGLCPCGIQGDVCLFVPSDGVVLLGRYPSLVLMHITHVVELRLHAQLPRRPITPHLLFTLPRFSPRILQRPFFCFWLPCQPTGLARSTILLLQHLSFWSQLPWHLFLLFANN